MGKQAIVLLLGLEASSSRAMIMKEMLWRSPTTSLMNMQTNFMDLRWGWGGKGTVSDLRLSDLDFSPLTVGCIVILTVYLTVKHIYALLLYMIFPDALNEACS